MDSAGNIVTERQCRWCLSGDRNAHPGGKQPNRTVNRNCSPSNDGPTAKVKAPAPPLGNGRQTRRQHTFSVPHARLARPIGAVASGTHASPEPAWCFHRAEEWARESSQVLPGALPLSWSRHWSHRSPPANLSRRCCPPRVFGGIMSSATLSGLQHHAGLPRSSRFYPCQLRRTRSRRSHPLRLFLHLASRRADAGNIPTIGVHSRVWLLCLSHLRRLLPFRRGTTPKRLWREPLSFDFIFVLVSLAFAGIECKARTNGAVLIPSHPGFIKIVKARGGCWWDSPQKPSKQRAEVSTRLSACSLIGGDGSVLSNIVATAREACMSCYIAISPAQSSGSRVEPRTGI